MTKRSKQTGYRTVHDERGNKTNKNKFSPFGPESNYIENVWADKHFEVIESSINELREAIEKIVQQAYYHQRIFENNRSLRPYRPQV